MNRDKIETLDNPLLQAWTDELGLPPFAAIEAGHFEPAFDAALAEHRAEIERIATQSEPPTFENSAAALDRSGRLLARIEPVFRSFLLRTPRLSCRRSSAGWHRGWPRTTRRSSAIRG
jgi:Zn-dependent oligopeptidase